MSRLTTLRGHMKKNGLDVVLITRSAHIRYLSGFSGSAGTMLVTSKKAVCMTDFRYKDQIAGELVKGVAAVITKEPYTEMLRGGYIGSGMTLGVQEEYVSAMAYQDLKKRFRGVKLADTKGMLSLLIAVKSDEELASMQRAADIASKVYTRVLKIAKPGMRENDLAAEISYIGRKLGSEGDAFDIIVASGYRGAMPHGRASDKKMKKGEMVTLDFGCICDGFNSDLTRTFGLGQPSPVAAKIHNIVLRSLKAGIAAARSGVSGKHVDDACRNLIVAEGYGQAFGHATGHGLGIEVHERPYVSFKGGDEILQPNMVITIEPGIYLEGDCGVRIEDDVVITSDGCKILTKAPRNLIIV